MRPPDGIGRDSTFGAGRPAWLGRLGNVRNVVRQEMISRQLDRHLPERPARVLDVGAGQGTQSIRLARAGHQVLAVEPDPAMRAAFGAALDAEPDQVRGRVRLRDGSVGSRLRTHVSWPRYSTSKNASAPPTRTASWRNSPT
jgi:SAM-dependent methyltransferase